MSYSDKFSFFNKKKVLITGNTGFIGSWLSLVLKELNADIYGYSLAPNTKPALFNLLDIGNFSKTMFSDIRDKLALEDYIEKIQPEVIFHLAAQPFVRDSYINPVDTYSVNVMGTVNILDIARKIKSVQRIIVMTTDKCYENVELERGYHENDRLGGRDPYSNSKACTELVVSAYRQSFLNEADIAIATVRAGNVIGGGDWANDRIIPDTVRSISNNEKVLVRSPLSIRPWQHVLEPVLGLIQLANKLGNANNEFCSEWNLGPLFTESHNVSDILNTFFEFWADAPGWALDKDNHPHESKLLKLDCSKAYEKLGWKPILTFNEMIRDTVDWYHSHLKNEDIAQLTNEQLISYIEKLDE